MFFTVSATRGTMPMYIYWRKEGVESPLNYTGGYYIPRVDQSHEGVYYAVVTNMVGSCVGPPIRFDVHRVATLPPVIVQTGYSAINGISATLEGQPDTVYRMRWTTDFVTWNWIPAYVVVEDSPGSIGDPSATSDSLRFYQAVSVDAFVPLP